MLAASSGHRQPGTALLWTKTDWEKESKHSELQDTEAVLISQGLCVTLKNTAWKRWLVLEIRCGQALEKIFPEYHTTLNMTAS